MKQDTILNYSLLFKKEPEGGYTVSVPSLPGCITYGKNIDEAKKMAGDAIETYIISLKKHKEPIPMDDSIFISNIILHIPSLGKISYV